MSDERLDLEYYKDWVKQYHSLNWTQSEKVLDEIERLREENEKLRDLITTQQEEDFYG